MVGETGQGTRKVFVTLTKFLDIDRPVVYESVGIRGALQFSALSFLYTGVFDVSRGYGPLDDFGSDERIYREKRNLLKRLIGCAT